MKVSLEFKLADLWIGAFWITEREDQTNMVPMRKRHIWVCLVPCFPINFEWWVS